jgi:hypothetical protein
MGRIIRTRRCCVLLCLLLGKLCPWIREFKDIIGQNGVTVLSSSVQMSLYSLLQTDERRLIEWH